ncbi:MAG: phosphoglycerate dehydrogenase [Ectothiorhodospiraceae bacterium]|nr:phosphoglycerate dehydrogenase [Ectothiorhodospiraceae bacterium]
MKIAYLVRARPDLADLIPKDIEYVIMEAGPRGVWRDEDLAKLHDVDAFVISMEPVNEQILAAAPNLKIVQRLGVGYETLDLAACARRGIPACNVEGVNKEAVAEHGMTLILALAKNLLPANEATQAADWIKGRMLTKRSFELAGKTLGIIGLGNTGWNLAKRAAAFDMKILYNDVRNIDPELARQVGAEPAEKDELLARSDIVSVNTDLNDTSRGMMDAEAFAKMQPHALFVCCARGGIVDEAALREALDEGRIAGAGIDVFEIEPIDPANPLIGAPNCVLTAHVAGVTDETMRRIWDWAHDNIRGVVERGEKARWVRNGV